MAEHEQGAERFQYAEYGYDIVDTKTDTQWNVTKGAAHPQKLLGLLNALESDLGALRQQLADAKAKAALADWMAAEDNDYDAAVFRSVFREFMRRYDALASPSRDTGSDLETQESLAARVEAEARKWANIEELNAVRPEFSDTGSDGGQRC